MFKINAKTARVILCILFLLCSATAGGIAFNTVNSTETADLTESIDRTSVEPNTYETGADVTTKAPNTGDPVMTTTIIEYTYYETEETTTAETTTAETTTAETTTVVTTTETTTAEITTVDTRTRRARVLRGR